jgi:hypothetical protein
MKRLLGALLLSLAPAVGVADTPAADWTVAYLAAASKPPERIGQVLERLDSDTGGLSPRALDLLVEYLIRNAADPELDGIDAARLAQIIDRRGGDRYVAAMRKVREQSGPVALEKAVLAYLVRHEPGDDGYVPGVINLSAQRTLHTIAALATEVTETRARKLGELAPGDTLDRLFEVMGTPQHVASFAMEIHRLRYYYRGAGRVVFGFVKGQGWRLQSVVADSLAFEPEMPYRANAAEVGQPDDARLRMIQLASGQPIAVKIAVDDSFHTPVSLEFLDSAAEYLAQHWRATDDDSEDTHALIVRLLGKYRGARYSSLFKEIATRTKSLKLRKWAKLSGKRSYESSASSFVAGSVDLAALAKKYPSLYPGVTYTSGQL